MSKKKILIPLIIFSTVLSTCSVYIYQMLYSPNFLINSDEKFITINEKIEFNQLIKSLERDTIINDILSFSVLSKIMEYQENIKEGAYKVKTNMSNYDMITMLRSGNQTPINITFSYARKMDDLAEKITEKLKISKDDLINYLYSNIKDYNDFNKSDIISIPLETCTSSFPALKLPVGLFFGSFNPIHNGHLNIAREVLNKTEIDNVWMVLSPESPYKKELLDKDDRYELMKMALMSEDNITISKVEFNLKSPNYTYLTLIELSKKFPNDNFIILMGEDNYKNIR